jgi:hypothetical protein
MNDRVAPSRQPVGRALLHIGTEVEASVEHAFDRWCEEHVRLDLKLPGFVAARRFTKWPDFPGAGDSPKSLTLYELEDVSALESDEYALHDRSIPDGFKGRMRFSRSVYRELGFHAGASANSRGTAILHVTVDVDPARTDAFLEWYVGKHVPAVLAAPGMIGARRFENVELRAAAKLPEGHHSYCTLYEMEEASVVSRRETLEAARTGSCPADLEPHRTAFNHVYEEIFRASRT